MSQFLSYHLDTPGLLEVMEEERLHGDDCSCLSETFGIVLIFGSGAFSYWNRFLRPHYHSCGVAWAA